MIYSYCLPHKQLEAVPHCLAEEDLGLSGVELDVFVRLQEVEQLSGVGQPEGERGGVGIGEAQLGHLCQEIGLNIPDNLDDDHLTHPGAELGVELGQSDVPDGGGQIGPVQCARLESGMGDVSRISAALMITSSPCRGCRLGPA